METPKTSSRSYKPRKHIPTPKMSERKKSLFTSARHRSPEHDSDSDLGIISPICLSSDEDATPRSFRSRSRSGSVRRVTRDLFADKYSNTEKYELIRCSLSDLDEDDEVPITVIDEKDLSAPIVLLTPSEATSIAKDPPRMTFRKTLSVDDSFTPHSTTSAKKDEPSKVRTSLSFTDGKISTKSFYGGSVAPPRETTTNISVLKELNRNPVFRIRHHITHRTRSRRESQINRGVSHKIRRMKPKHFTKKISKKQLMDTLDVIADPESTGDEVNQHQIERVKQILRNSKPKPGRPLQVGVAEDEYFTDDEDEEAEPMKENRKFFKSKTKAKYRVLNHIVTVGNGKFIIEPRQPKTATKRKLHVAFDDEEEEFDVVHTEVDDLLKNLDGPERKSGDVSHSINRLASDIAAWNPVSNQSVPESPQVTQRDQTQTYFPVFYKGQTKEPEIAQAPKRQRSDLVLGLGDNQLQIDAGQKEFGAIECKACGFVYTQHVPEDEQLHRTFHESIKSLDFKGWDRENVILADIPEWGIRGRVIAVTVQDPKHKITKAAEIVRHIDMELGFPPVEQNQRAITYIACNHKEVMGVCVAQPLREANKLISDFGIDFCSAETYPVRCGISRIWVNSKYRRQGVASKLMTAVRSHFLFGGYLALEEIAFSAPTEMGKLFAQKLFQRNDFLVYQ